MTSLISLHNKGPFAAYQRLRDTLIAPHVLTRFGAAGADAFTIKKVAGHSSVTISERHIHPTPEGQERAFERFANMNDEAVENAETTASRYSFRNSAIQPPVSSYAISFLCSRCFSLSEHLVQRFPGQEPSVNDDRCDSPRVTDVFERACF